MTFIITSLQNDKVKQVRALQTVAKTRRAENRIVLEGMRLITDALDSGARPDYVLYTADAMTHRPGVVLFNRLVTDLIECIEVTPEVMTHMADTQTPQGWLAVFVTPELPLPSAPTLLLILSGVADPGNLGTILRTAAAAAVDGVILTPGCVDAFNPKTLRGGMGAHFRIPLRRLTWPEIQQEYGHLPLRVADAAGEVAYTTVDWRLPAGLIIGGEARGADDEALSFAAERIAIPMGNAAESLNAAMAAAVILFEARRQRSI
jgi:TrmH family RNA methyltransferase